MNDFTDMSNHSRSSLLIFLFDAQARQMSEALAPLLHEETAS